MQKTNSIETNNMSDIHRSSSSINRTQKKRGRKKQVVPQTRKRLRASKTWIRHIEKLKKTKGEEFINIKGQLVAKKTSLNV